MTEKQLRARPHQREALNQIISAFKKHDRGQCIMACGTGKTRVGLLVAEKLNSMCTLIMVPSISLIGQMIREWRDNYKDELAILGVCSDATTAATGEEDEDGLSSAQLEQETGIQVTTDPNVIATFLRLPVRRVVICTYQSGETLELAQMKKKVPAFNLAILDEAHKTAGRSNGLFATVLDQSRIRADKRLFMTATPRMYGSSTEGTVETSSMDDVKQYGPVFYRLGFSDAVAKGLLVDWKAVIAIVDDDDVAALIRKKKHIRFGKDEYRAEDIAQHVALAKVIKQEKLKKIITFHNRVSKAANFADQHGRVSLQLPKELQSKHMWIRHVSAYQDSRVRLMTQKTFAGLDSDSIAILTNAQCLTEGVDIPSVDAVMFNDPKRSVIAIVQAVGRAMRTAPGKTQGVIVIPVFVSSKKSKEHATETGDAWDTILDGTNFKHVRNVLMALRSNDDAFGAAMATVQRQVINNPGSRVITIDEAKPGLKKGTMIAAPERANEIVEIRNGRGYDVEGREVVSVLPKNISTSGGGEAWKMPDDSFVRAILTKGVKWTTSWKETTAEEVVKFFREHRRMPARRTNASMPEQTLAARLGYLRTEHTRKTT